MSSPGYPLADAAADGGIEERGWVPTDWAATAEEAVTWFAERWPEALEPIHDDGMELVPARDPQGEPIIEWMRQGPCPACEEHPGGGPRPRVGPWPGELAEGPRPACSACQGTGEQHEDRDTVFWSKCEPDADGAVQFWLLLVEER